ncbi:type VII secretion protein EccB [Actinoplanes sp. NBRC 14428]|uniref:Type VII secretion protein EccB n=1 Tax=Pseudosporangium ferrugineum TaxID=439699 RepID=A0A2T0S1V3_9ACTN|nr:type VII secretion protein EccB [Pseudosporangium ferrugineum]PRY27303.1 type VII secretion protein EccB [Pseudosporangium ferrugineum]BCJ53364.1 type VII secretion protein EccB [Actinoplanes sp. NBRC 14428]
MPSRQDQLHSYQYAQQRVVAALVTHDPDPHRSPLRRAGTTVLVSLVVAALAVGGAAVYGLLKGRSTVEPRDESVVFLEKGTGARYVYLKSDDKMHPVLNYASGLLIANAPAPEMKNASRESLAEVPLGDPLGIADAPDSLPPAKGGLVKNLWTVCSQATQGPAGTQSVLSVGEGAGGGTTLPVPQADTPADQLRGLLVTDPADRTFLVYNNKRFLIPASRLQQTRVWFRWNQAALPVSAAWINAVPIGPDLKPPAIPDWGDPSAEISDYEVGQILRIHSDGNTADQWGVVLGDGVADLTDVQANLMQTDPEAYSVREMDLTLYGNLPRSKTQLVTAANAAGLPPAVPVLLNGPDSVCLTYDGAANGGVTIRIGAAMPGGTAVTGEPAAPGGVQVDRVHVPRGKGAVVVSAASPSAPAGSGTVSVITDTGRRYPLADREVLAKLGYGGVQPQTVPGQLVALLPQGPALDPERARQANAEQKNP